MAKKILFLGGAPSQVPIIKEAKRRGYYVITCDYLPNNPGHKFADEYFNVSTTDQLAVLKLAQQIKPDYIIAYASDPAAPVAAFVSEKLNLPGNSYQSVRNLAEKDLFRKLQKENGFIVPDSIVLSAYEELKSELKFPVIVKPTDSSGSKGVSKVNSPETLKSAIEFALNFSKKRKVIIEEFIDNEIADLHGDGFVINGELVFTCLGDHIYNKKSNPFNPIGTLWPSEQTNEIIKKIEEDVSRLVKISGYLNGPINIEARINSLGQHFIMEIGPRNGGHFVPQAIFYSTGFDMVAALLDIYENNQIIIPTNLRHFSAYYAIHSDAEGILEQIIIDEKIKRYIKENHQYLAVGDQVKSFTAANAVIGIILFKFNRREDMINVFNNINLLVKIKLN